MYRDSQKIVVEDAQAPSASYIINVKMEDLVEKLKLLNYDAEFVQELKMKSINR